MKTGKIYKIISTQGNEIYIGSTFNTTRDRFKQHKSDYKRWKEGNCPNISVFKLFEKYGIDNCKMVLIKQYDIIDRKHLEVYELLWCYKLRFNCVNTNQQFHIKKIYGKQYRAQNKEHRQKLHQQYYQNNKEQFLQQFNCDCGGKYTYKKKSRHIKTQKHQKWLEKQNQN